MDKYGLIGYPLGHSASATLFNEKFNRESILATYHLYPITNIELIKYIAPNLKGFNVTIPYKTAIIPYLTAVSNRAKEVGAVNCVKVIDGNLYGYNTDVVGVEDSLLDVDKIVKALILGTGGAAKAVEYVLKKRGIEYKVVSRSNQRGDITYSQISETILAQYRLIINATPIGMYPNINDYPPLPYSALTSSHILFDVIYNPEITIFLQKGIEHGCQIISGKKMFLSQANASWQIWSSKETL